MSRSGSMRLSSRVARRGEQRVLRWGMRRVPSCLIIDLRVRQYEE